MTLTKWWPELKQEILTKNKMRKKQKIEYQVGKIWPMCKIAVGLVRDNPELMNDEDGLKRALLESIPELKDKEHCANCGRGMKIQIYKADLHAALFLLAMARVVRQNLNKGMSFTDANKVHVPTLSVTNAVSKHITHCDYLGLVKQGPELRGTGYWSITTWGWKALRGERIPAYAKYWSGKLIGRAEDETVTLSQMFKVHRDLVNRAIAMRRKVRSDHRDKFSDYNPAEWSEIAGYIRSEIM